MDGVGATVSEQLLWFSLGAIDNDDVRLLCGHVLESHRFFYEPTVPMQSVHLRTGAMAPHRITPSTSSISTGATRVSWDQVVREGLETVEECRALLTAAIDSGDYPPDITEAFRGWLDVCRPPALADITPQLRLECRRADDPRLASIPFPSHARPVVTLPMAPLPGPPDQSRVPAHATGWHHVLKPWYFRQCEVYYTRMRAWHHYVIEHGTSEGAPVVPQVAFGSWGFEPWAGALIDEGHVLVRQEGLIQIMDCSLTPTTHWNREYLDEVLRNSTDLGLRDAVLTHGVSFLADLPNMVVLLRHLPGLAGPGYQSVNSELLRLTLLMWYSFTYVFVDGAVEFPCLCCRVISHMAVPRARSDRWRRVADNGQPRRELLTIGEVRVLVISMATACGWDDSKRRRRELLGPPRSYLRHSPAFRRPPVPVQHDVPASSKTPLQIQQMQRDGLLTAQEAAFQLQQPRHAPELKPLFVDLLLVVCLQAYMCFLAGWRLMGLGDDESDCFHQFTLALYQRWACGIVMPDPVQTLAGLLTPELVQYLEHCMSMGTPPSSPYAQRLNT